MSKATKIPPVGMHEDVIARHFLVDEATSGRVPDARLEELHRAAQFGRETARTILTSHDAILQNKMATPLANERVAREMAFKRLKEVTGRIDAAVARASCHADGLTQHLAGPPRATDVAGLMLASEIRACLAGRTPSEREKMISEGMPDSANVVMSAVLNAPPALSGLSPTEQEAIRHQWRVQRYPEMLDERDRLNHAIQDLLNAGSAMITFVNGLTDARSIELACASEQKAKEASRG